jgi:hypothetical protein
MPFIGLAPKLLSSSEMISPEERLNDEALTRGLLFKRSQKVTTSLDHNLTKKLKNLSLEKNKI